MKYVGARWYKCDFHLHTEQSKCFSRQDITHDQWIQKVQEQGLECIAITDHNDFRSIDDIIEKGRKEDIAVFPGVEITCDSTKIHLLVLFDIDDGSETVQDFLIKCDVCRASFGESVGTSNSIFNVCKIAKDFNGIVIAAHIDEYSGINNMSHANLEKILDRQYLDAVQVVNADVWDRYPKNEQITEAMDLLQKKYGSSLSENDVKKWKKAYSLAKKSPLPMLMFSDNPESEGSSSHGIEGIGSTYTWFKMDSAPTLEGIRQALLSDEARVRPCNQNKDRPENLPDFWIESLTLNHSKINTSPMCIHFNPQLNTIIGGRGSGKSTILRLLSGGLINNNDEKSPIIQDEQRQYYKRHSLKDESGIFEKNSSFEITMFRYGKKYRVSCSDILDADNQRITVEREENEKWIQEEDENMLEFLKIQTYAQKEFFEIAKDSNALMNIIDKEIPEYDTVVGETEQIATKLLALMTDIRNTDEVINKESIVQSELKDIEQIIETYNESGLSEQIDKRRNYAKYNNIINSLFDATDALVESIESSLQEKQLPDVFESLKNDDVQDLNDILSKYSEIIAKEIETINTSLKRIRGYRNKADCDINESAWKKAERELENQYSTTCEKLLADGLVVDKLEQTLENERIKRGELERIEHFKREKKRHLKKKEELERAYLESRNKINDLRKRHLANILQNEQNIRITIKPYSNMDSLEKKILEITQKDNDTIRKDIETIKSEILKSDALEGLNTFKRNLHSIRESAEDNKYSAIFRNSIKALTNDQFDRLIAYYPEDELIVQYKPDRGKKFQPISTASAGQKTTTILTFALSHGDIPLLLDQPEDDLDNKLVYDLVVKRLAHAKQKRQVIVVTHNANIPVNGDAEYIISMDSDSRYVKTKCAGTLDQSAIREEICDVMEGTQHAFEMRAKKYHLND